MTTMVLVVLVPGVILLAITIDIAVVFGWLHGRRWR
jgi:hypothetical protein